MISMFMAATFIDEKVDWKTDVTATFTVKTSERVYNSETKTSEYENVYIQVKTFSKLGDNIREKMAKGDVVIISGKLDSVRAYNKSDGSLGTNITIIADSVTKAPKQFTPDSDTEVEEDPTPVVTPPVVTRRPPPGRPAPTAKTTF